MLISPLIGPATTTTRCAVSTLSWLDIYLGKKWPLTVMNFIDGERCWPARKKKKTSTMNKREFFLSQGFAEENMDHVIVWLFLMRLLKINLILIWANARNTISHWPRVSYDWLDILNSTVLCFYSAVSSAETGSFQQLLLSLFSSWTSAPTSFPPFSSWKHNCINVSQRASSKSAASVYRLFNHSKC